KSDLSVVKNGNYWDVVNEYKPLMHTWSLGVEEQYYLLYPLLFLILGKARRSWLLPLLIFLTAVSVILFFSPSIERYEKFYLLPFRFFELSLGGIAVIVFRGRLVDHRLSFGFLLRNYSGPAEPPRRFCLNTRRGSG
ncbi:acyltransferase family protein, partial [uncultured Thiodictyon sp.]|uniref:acyltransferase family protein n=1 Tax=uncultured Thiodictyon sp. TaxID=1846217 RepID=UPI0025F7ECB0